LLDGAFDTARGGAVLVIVFGLFFAAVIGGFDEGADGIGDDVGVKDDFAVERF